MFGVFRAMPDADPTHYVRGQYEGYRAIDGVAPDSTTETYAALRLEIDNWRWSGVPFFIRTGKSLPVTADRAAARLPPPAATGLPPGPQRPEPDQIVIKLDPTTGIRLLVEPSARDGPSPSRSTSTWSSAQEGGEGAAPYEVLLHAAMNGDSARFTRQDSVEEAWRILQPLLDAPPPVHEYAKGSWGPEAADKLVSRYGGWHGPWTAHEHDTTKTSRCRHDAAERRGAVAVPADRRLRVPVQLPHGRAVAPDGAIDWLCVPRFDSPSVFGTLLDREAGSFRLGPFGINHPVGASCTSRARTPSLTTWKTPTGWIMVRDALTMGPRRGEDEITPHTRPPADDDGDHMLVRTVLCLDGEVEVELVCEPVFDYGRVPAEWTLVGDGPPHGRRQRRRTDDPAADRHGGRHRGRPGAGAARARAGRPDLLRALVGRGAGGAGGRRRGPRAAGRHDAVLALLARAARVCPTTACASRSSARR